MGRQSSCRCLWNDGDSRYGRVGRVARCTIGKSLLTATNLFDGDRGHDDLNISRSRSQERGRVPAIGLIERYERDGRSDLKKVEESKAIKDTGT